MKKLLLLLAGLVAGTSAPAALSTLLELTHAEIAPAHLRESVVIIIDAQREYVDGRLPLAGIESALAQTQRLLVRARAAGVPIVHIQQVSAPGRGIFEAGGRLVDFCPQSAPQPGEIVITKQLPNAFAGTALDDTLRRLGRKSLVVSGYMTHMCVSATARAALDLGYRATVIGDACATRDLPGDEGGALPAETVHRVALAELADRFAAVVATLDHIPD